jgi:hypothetical protein
MPRLMCGTLPPLSVYAFMAGTFDTEATLPFILTYQISTRWYMLKVGNKSCIMCNYCVFVIRHYQVYSGI